MTRLLYILILFSIFSQNVFAQDGGDNVGAREEDFEFSESGLNIRLRPNYLPMARTPGNYEGGAFLDLGGGAYIYFDGLYFGSRRDFFVPPTSEENAYIGLIPRSWLPQPSRLEDSFGHRLYDTLNSKEAGMIGGGRFLNMTMMEIALMYGLDPTVPRLGFDADPIYGQQRFNSLYNPADFMLGTISFRDNDDQNNR